MIVSLRMRDQGQEGVLMALLLVAVGLPLHSTPGKTHIQARTAQNGLRLVSLEILEFDGQALDSHILAFPTMAYGPSCSVVPAVSIAHNKLETS